MSQPPQGQSRVCPTRTDDRPALFAHKVNQAQCQDRQRGRYHKCYTCVFNNAWVASKGRPGNQLRSTAPAEAGALVKPELVAVPVE
jgi:hypothetical protein